jgi:predicted nucleic acid-binding Zn ribbon protein
MMLTRRFEVCAYRHCTNEFRPKREAQRFCSPRCREAYRYDQKLLKQGGRERLEARKKRLGQGHLKARKKQEKAQQKQSSTERGFP